MTEPVALALGSAALPADAVVPAQSNIRIARHARPRDIARGCQFRDWATPAKIFSACTRRDSAAGHSMRS